MEEIKQTYGVCFEPFQMKSVDRIYFPSNEERAKALEEAHFNPYLLRSNKVIIDLLTDSGSNCMSSSQWSALHSGDESYAGSSSFYRLLDTVRSITGYPELIPTHQGRAAERILYPFLCSDGGVAVSNSFYDTTKVHVENCGVETVDLLQYPDMNDPATKDVIFKGNIDVAKLSKMLEASDNNIKLVVMTITNNTYCGLPCSMENIRETSELCKKFGIAMYFDACRYAENCYFIKVHEPGFKEMKLEEIALQMFSYGDGCIMSTKKDGMCNIGGYIAVKDPDLATKCRQVCILTEGFPTYGGLTGRDMDAMAIGLRECLSEDFLSWRMGQVRYLAQLLKDAGVPVLLPAGGHAVYIDATAFLPHIPKAQYPAWALTCEVYLKGGIRATEVGSIMEPESTNEFVRFAIPRRVYSNTHMLYVSKVLAEVYKCRDSVPGYCITESAPTLRHYSIKMKPAN